MSYLYLLLFALISAVMGWPVAQAQTDTDAPPVEALTVEVLNVYPHDPGAYTQGLLLHDGLLYESAGRYGVSNLRQVDPQTGAVLRQVNLPHYVFAEGLALVNGRLIQLTWREQIAFIYDMEAFATDSLNVVEVVQYPGEGWGLCFDGTDIYMTSGSHILQRRDAETFDLLEQIEVRLNDEPLRNLNELECVGDSVYANIYLTDSIVRIDKASGRVTAMIDAAGLLTAEETAALGAGDIPTSALIFSSQQQTFIPRQVTRSGYVLNGIAYNPESDTFYITGKSWPKLFEVRFVTTD